MKAAYAASGALSFKPDALEAGKYRVDVLVSEDTVALAE
jgi:hypothetical protein